MGEARLFQALSDATRLKIVGILAGGPLNVTGIVERVKAAQPAVSRHLRILREVGLIRDRRLGKQVEYSLEPGRVREASSWLADLAKSGGGAGGASGREDIGYGGDKGGGEPEAGKRVRRISPLDARAGVSRREPVGGEMSNDVPEKPPPRETVKSRTRVGKRRKGAGIQRSGRKRRRRKVHAKIEGPAGSGPGSVGEPEYEISRAEDREDEGMDDFLL